MARTSLPHHARLGASVLLIAVCATADAGLIAGYPDAVQAYDPREVAKLPRYCIYTQSFRDHVPGGDDVQEVKRWYATLGPSFHALHHYCWAMMKSNRALTLARTAQARDYYLGAALDDLDYMVNNSKPGFALLPEVLNFRAETLVRLGFGARAVLDCERAIELKPDYWPPYATLSDFYKSVGEVGKARETLQKGLQSSPNSKALAGRLAALNVGKPPR